jgi:CRP-like cAMP-binding protein
MDRNEGLRVLTRRGWLSATPAVFQHALLAGCGWYRVEAGAPIQVGGETTGELIGLAQGCIEMTTTLGAADTPIMHLAHPPFWFGYFPIIFGQSRRISATARTPVWLASVPQAKVRGLLAERPARWEHFLPLALVYGDTVVTIAADLLIRSTERRCAAVLLRMGGCRFTGPEDAAAIDIPLTQDELAAAANLSRNTTGTVLRKLAARGLVELGYRGMVVRAPSALRAFVDSA